MVTEWELAWKNN